MEFSPTTIGLWASPSYEISEDEKRCFLVYDKNRKLHLATFMFFADAKEFTKRKIAEDIEAGGFLLNQKTFSKASDPTAREAIQI